MQLYNSFDKVSSLIFYVVVCCILHAEARHNKRQSCKSSGIDILSSTGVKIEPVTISRVQLPRLSRSFSSEGHKLTFEFKTSSPSGLLFYGTQPDHPSTRMIALQMVHGILFFTIRCPSADVVLRLPIKERLDDGLWHTIEFRRKGRKGYITVDGRPYFRRYPATCKLKSFVFGGMNTNDQHALRPLFRRNRQHFDGCMRNLRLNVDLDSSPEYYAVSICS